MRSLRFDNLPEEDWTAEGRPAGARKTRLCFSSLSCPKFIRASQKRYPYGAFFMFERKRPDEKPAVRKVLEIALARDYLRVAKYLVIVSSVNN